MRFTMLASPTLQRCLSPRMLSTLMWVGLVAACGSGGSDPDATVDANLNDAPPPDAPPAPTVVLLLRSNNEFGCPCFQPDMVTIRVRGSVTFRNADLDGKAHHMCGGIPEMQGDCTWINELITKDNEFTLPFPTPGEYPFFGGIPHPWATGKITVVP